MFSETLVKKVSLGRAESSSLLVPDLVVCPPGSFRVQDLRCEVVGNIWQVPMCEVGLSRNAMKSGGHKDAVPLCPCRRCQHHHNHTRMLEDRIERHLWCQILLCCIARLCT